MVYVLGLIVMLSFIFSAVSGTNFMGNLWDQATQKMSGFAFPKSQKEIIIDNLESQYSELNRFFSSVAPSLLNSNSLSPQDKESLQKAVQNLEESQNTIERLKNIEKEGKSVTKALVKKVLDLNMEPNSDPENKESLQKAAQNLEESQNTIERPDEPEKEEKSITRIVIEKIFNLNTEPNPDSIPIPSNCNLVCGE